MGGRGCCGPLCVVPLWILGGLMPLCRGPACLSGLSTRRRLPTQTPSHLQQLVPHRGRGRSAPHACSRYLGEVACCVTSTCPACGGDFRSCIRALRHLVHGASSCVAAWDGDFLAVCDPPLVEAADERDRIDRASRRRLGVRDVCGLSFLKAVAVALGPPPLQTWLACRFPFVSLCL